VARRPMNVLRPPYSVPLNSYCTHGIRNRGVGDGDGTRELWAALGRSSRDADAAWGFTRTISTDVLLSTWKTPTAFDLMHSPMSRSNHPGQAICRSIVIVTKGETTSSASSSASFLLPPFSMQPVGPGMQAHRETPSPPVASKRMKHPTG